VRGHRRVEREREREKSDAAECALFVVARCRSRIEGDETCDGREWWIFLVVVVVVVVVQSSHDGSSMRKERVCPLTIVVVVVGTPTTEEKEERDEGKEDERRRRDDVVAFRCHDDEATPTGSDDAVEANSCTFFSHEDEAHDRADERKETTSSAASDGNGEQERW
jgi:hypothetical protein